MATRLPKDYSPSEKEPFMNAKQKEFFRRKLLAWRSDIIQETKDTLNNLQKEVVNFSDLADRASSCLLYTSPSPRDLSTSRMPSSA